MASQSKKLNPNATPFSILPHSRLTLQSTLYQIPYVPNWGYTHVSAPFYPTSHHLQPGFLPREKRFYGEIERPVEEVKNETEIASNGFRNKAQKMTSLVGNFNGKTSLMIRNIPNQLQRHDLLQVLDKHCLEVNIKERVKSAYDFVYLPMDFRRNGNLGYAFVNFTTSVGASRFSKAFSGYKWDVPTNKKTCEICFATLQGKSALTHHFKNSVFQCKTSDYLPAVLSPPRGIGAFSRIICIGKLSEKGESNHAASRTT
ncbi:MEI2 C-terminal RRM only like 1 [Euphorbia peplus]|nr:MEI2 C-terminal RRM only like 1 [Euphorbia peplus]